MHHVQNSRIEPRGFTIAKRIIQIESALHAFEQRKRLEVADGHTVFIDHRGVNSAQRKTFFRWKTYQKQFNTTAQLCVINVLRVAMSKTVELAIPDCRCFAR